MYTRHSILGIDVGKDALVVGFLPDHDLDHPKNWRTVVTLSYKDPRWWVQLIDLIDEQAVVAAEPTGHHLLAPVASILYTYRPGAQIWQVEGKQTAFYRESFVAGAKNDRLDAIALTLIARDIAAGSPPRNCRPYNHFLESAVQRLRMLVNSHVRLTKENTRTKNRLNVLAHSLFPAFAGSETWARAVRQGAITPAQVKALALEPPFDYHGTARRFLKALADNLPNIDSDPAVVAAIEDELQRQRLTDEQIAIVGAQIRAVINHPPFGTVTRRWGSVPGAGDLAIAALHVATLGRATELSKNEFRAAIGVSPRTSTSGSIDRTSKSRSGYTPAKTALHLWAMALVRSNADNRIAAYYRAGEGRSFAAARNKLARVLWGVARSPEGYRYTPPGSSAAAGEAGEYPPADSPQGAAP